MGTEGPSSGEGWVGRDPGVEKHGWGGAQERTGMANKEPRSGEGWGPRHPGVKRDE